jgi:selenocysteine lyase/cysteine desulfurase
VALGAAGCSSGAGDADEPADRASGGDQPFDPGDWESVRAQFPLTSDLRHFAAFVLAAHPQPVAEAIERYREALDADTEAALNELGILEDAARGAAASYLDVQPEEIALTDSTTMGLGLLYNGLRLAEGDEVVTTEHDFYATHEALRLRSRRDGATVREVRLYEHSNPANASVDGIVTNLLGAVTPATRAVAVTWVHSSTGVKLPVAELAAALAEVNTGRDEADRALLCVDGVHGFGIEDVTAADLGCDFLVSGTHKWLFGPRGTGLVWGTREAWSRVVPIIPSFSTEGFAGWIAGTDPDENRPGYLNTPGGYHSFEHRWAVADAFEFHEAIGKAQVQERTWSQATRLKEGLADIDGVDVVTPASPELSAGIVCVDVAGREPLGLVQELHQQRIIASVTPYATRYLRLGPSIVTSPDEVDEAVAALAAILSG